MKKAKDVLWVSVIIVVMAYGGSVFATVEERDITEKRQMLEEVKQLFHKGKPSEAVPLLKNLVFSPYEGVLGQAELAELLCDLLRYIRRNVKGAELGNADALLKEIETKLRGGLGDVKKWPKSVARVQHAIDYVVRTRFDLSKKMPEGTDPAILQKELSSRKTLTEAEADALLKKAANIADKTKGITAATEIVRKMPAYRGWFLEYRRVVALSKLGKVLKEEDPIQSMRCYEALWDWGRTQQMDEIISHAGLKAGKEIGKLIQEARHATNRSFWKKPRQDKLSKAEIKAMMMMLDDFSQAIGKRDIAGIKKLFHPKSPFLTKVLSTLKDKNIISIRYSDFVPQPLTPSGRSVSFGCTVHIVHEVDGERKTVSGLRDGAFRKFKDEWRIYAP